jgi:para-aminobenzoate synthetase component 1
VREINISANLLVKSLLNLAEENRVCLLDSCGVNHLGSHLLVAGLNPLETLEISNSDAQETLQILENKFNQNNLSFLFTISYDFGLKLENIQPRPKEFKTFPEPDIFLAAFDSLIIYDYDKKKAFLTGNEERFEEIENLLKAASKKGDKFDLEVKEKSIISSNFTRQSYISTIKKVKEYIQRGDTYQTNLTQQICAELAEDLTPERIFWRLRKNHPAPFAAFIKRENDTVVSISPERFFKVRSGIICTSPIKGTRPRGKTIEEDLQLKYELINSEKDRAENVMIVDLLRNDLGRICKFGSVKVEKLCDLEQHPTLSHLVSTIKGELREEIDFPDIIRAVFPCGSITGAPKIRTMQIINELETANRGLSMGAIGYFIPDSRFQIPDSIMDLNVAIRSMIVRGNEAIFNVGGGIVAGSEPEKEYEETIVKARAILSAINADF